MDGKSFSERRGPLRARPPGLLWPQAGSTGTCRPSQPWLGRTIPPSRRQGALGRHPVGQSQQQRQPLPVPGQPPVAHLGLAQAPLHIQERMLHLGPDRVLQLLRQRLPRFPAPTADAGRASSPPATPPPTHASPTEGGSSGSWSRPAALPSASNPPTASPTPPPGAGPPFQDHSSCRTTACSDPQHGRQLTGPAPRPALG